MKLRVIEVTVKIEVLSVDSVPGLLHQAARRIEEEQISGAIYHDDGDQVEWQTLFGTPLEVQP